MGQGGLVVMTRNLAPINWALAADYSRQISEPMCACASFAWCARFAPLPDEEKLIDKAFEWAERGEDAFQRVAGTAMPLRALVEIGDHARAEREFDRIAPLASLISPQSSRAEACLRVYEAVAVARREFALKALRWLLAECQPVDHWRARRAICIAFIEAVSLYRINPAAILSWVQNELRNNITIRLNQGEADWPAKFFWPLR